MKSSLTTVFILFVLIANIQAQSIIDSLKPGHWIEIPNSKMQSVFPANPPGNPKAIMNSWCGGAYDSKRDQLIVWGGGHADYAGNEVYAFNIKTLSWKRLTNPSTNMGTDEASGYYLDGLPRSRHTYNNLQYLPDPVDRFASFGGLFQYQTGGYSTNHLDAFNLSSNSWERKTDGFDAGGISAYDPVTGHVFSHGYGGSTYLSEYNPQSNSWTAHGNMWTLNGWMNFHTAAIDPIRRKMIAVGAASDLKKGEIYSFDISLAGDIVPEIVATVGDTDFTKNAVPGFEYNPAIQKFVGWSGGADVYTLDISGSTPVWIKIPPAPGNDVVPTVAASNGTYGRFRYIPSKNVFIAVNATDENVYIYRLSDKMDTIAPAGVTGLQTTALTGSSVTLKWNASTDNVGVAGYEIYRNNIKVGVSTNTTYSDTGLNVLTTYKYKVLAYDAPYNRSGFSSSIDATTKGTASVSLDDILPGQWVEIPNSKLEKVIPNPLPLGWTGGKAIMDAWSGGAYDSKRDRFIIWGGGHTDYSGNEIYAFDIKSMSWSRLTNPSSDVGGDEASGYYPDGLPRSRHTYNQLQYLPEPADRFCAFGSFGTYMNAIPNKRLDAFDFDSLKWERKTDANDAGGMTAYDPATGHVFSHGVGNGDYLNEYNPTTNSWIKHGNQFTDPALNFHTAAIDPERRKMIAVGSGSGLAEGEIWTWDISLSGTIAAKKMTTTGATEITKQSVPGFEYDPLTKKFVAWNGGKDVYTLDMSTATPTWAKVTISGSNTVTPTAANPQGTYGRFRYVPSKNVFIAVNKTNENIFVFRLTKNDDVTPPTNPANLVSTTVSYEKVSLSWTASTDENGVSGYEIYRDGAKIASTSVNTYTDNSVVPSKTYVYKVLAYDANNNKSGFSNLLEIETPVYHDEIAPTTPTSLITTSTSANCVNLSWAASSDNLAVTGYEFYRNGKSAGTSNTLSYSDCGLSEATSYSYVVKAFDAAGNKSLESNTVVGTTTSTSVIKLIDVKFEELAKDGNPKNNLPVTFGHVFTKGDVPAGYGIVAKTIGGSDIPLQMDLKATHSDGSIRHAILTVNVSSLTSGEIKTIQLYKSNVLSKDTAVSVSEVVANGFKAEVKINIGATEYTAATKDYLTNASKSWLSGPLASEWIVSAPLKDNSGNIHPHLAVQFNIRAHKINGTVSKIRVSTVIENNWTYEPNPGNFTYDASILVNGAEVYKKTSLTHYHHARWRKVFWSGAEPKVHVKHNKDYLIQTGTVPNYDKDLVIPESALKAVDTQWKNAKSGPMENALITPYMPETGGRSDIGPFPSWTSTYLLSMDSRAATSTNGTAEAASSFPIHFRNKNTGLPTTIDAYPYVTILGNPGDAINPKTGKSEALPILTANSTTPYSPDSPHQPSLAYFPYLVTGDYYFMEELEFWNNYNILQATPEYRGFEKGLLKWDQIRGAAWSLRTFGQTAYIIPDNHPKKQHYKDLVQNNIKWYEENYVDKTAGNELANDLGWVGPLIYEAPYNQTSPWMDDFFTWAVGHLASLDFDVNKLLSWKAQFPVGRMLAPDYSYIFGSPYHAQVQDASNVAFANFKQVYEATVKISYPDKAQQIINANYDLTKIASIVGLDVGEMAGYSSSPEGYPSNLQPALAVAVESGIEGAKEAWTTFMNRSVKPDYSTEPNFDIVPRFFPEVITSLPADKAELNSGVNIYPNPANDSLTINCGTELIKKVSITDVQGKVVYESFSELSGVKTLSLKGLSKGMYFMSVQLNQDRIVRKIVVE